VKVKLRGGGVGVGSIHFTRITFIIIIVILESRIGYKSTIWRGWIVDGHIEAKQLFLTQMGLGNSF
jgi:hypothetical protein